MDALIRIRIRIQHTQKICDEVYEICTRHPLRGFSDSLGVHLFLKLRTNVTCASKWIRGKHLGKLCRRLDFVILRWSDCDISYSQFLIKISVVWRAYLKLAGVPQGLQMFLAFWTNIWCQIDQKCSKTCYKRMPKIPMYTFENRRYHFLHFACSQCARIGRSRSQRIF